MKTTQFTLNVPMETTKGLIAVRDQKIHNSSLMLLSIVDRVQQNNSNLPVYIGEVEAVYHTYRVARTARTSYTYSGIATMLRAMHRRGFLNKGRKDGYVTYSLASKGAKVLDSLKI